MEAAQVNPTRPMVPATMEPVGPFILARVLEAQSGEARWVECPDGATLAPMAHAQGVPALRPGDRVLVLTQTTTGPIVLDRLRRHGEAPPCTGLTERDGRVHLRAEQGLYLRCGAASISLDPEGRMEMRGRELHGIMARVMHFLAARIHFN
ncbi:hypothetical protein [Ectothiorhodospira lacustris]|uniref:hypothetical protein n=1 Tax=Ectothiorhodospira lacustris TaxID=2899127 RepID=UPI001EE8C223|nr:hypothetical protein [Ectothiorhodospira lacustris]MCG5499324.1 hypothetical protein [Ectothiorhodospira lacustris]MCG5509213.1 hypothetical protein [Ectothiorhodospira lacustris]MCG5521003.1 hypothetical protein [Ectothiorhodospira lacustris]